MESVTVTEILAPFFFLALLVDAKLT
jgi:hypothetical protein